MSKYIDAEALDGLMKAIVDWAQTDGEKAIARVMYNTFHAFPAADVAPVVRGHIVRKVINERGAKRRYCSECGARQGKKYPRYCYYCGAKMDEQSGADMREVQG